MKQSQKTAISRTLQVLAAHAALAAQRADSTSGRAAQFERNAAKELEAAAVGLRATFNKGK